MTPDPPDDCPRHGDPVPDTRPYTLAVLYLWRKGLANIGEWVMDMGGPIKANRVVPTRLRHWKQTFYQFNNCVYQEQDHGDMQSRVAMFLNEQKFLNAKHDVKPLRVTSNLVNDVLFQIASICHVCSPAMPCWIDDESDRPDPADVIAFHNGTADLQTLINGGDVELSAPSSTWFSTSVLPFEHTGYSECQRWLDFLNSLWPGDPMTIRGLQEFFGYCMTRRMTMRNILWLHGPSAAGKSTIITLLQKLVGMSNTVSCDVSVLMGEFTLQTFMGKHIAVFPDAHLGNGNQADQILGRIKTISGGDAVMVNRKRIDMLPSVQLTTRMVFATNDLFKMTDASSALQRRTVFVPFTKAFIGKENRNLAAELERELPGIARWALDGLRRLFNQGDFTISLASKQLAQSFENLQSPIRVFSDDCLEAVAYKARQNGTAAVGMLDKSVLYRVYREYSEKEAGLKPMSKERFFLQLYRIIPSLADGHRRNGGEARSEIRGCQFNEDTIRKFTNLIHGLWDNSSLP